MDKGIFIIVLSIILTTTNCVAHTAIVKPLALKKGDTVAIVAPSFQFEKEQVLRVFAWNCTKPNQHIFFSP